VNIGEKIKIRRKELDWSLQDLADRMGYANKSTIARIESGAIDVPQSKVVKFAEVMGTTVGFLMDWEQVEKKNDQLVGLIARLRIDESFAESVKMLDQLKPEQLASFKQLLSTFVEE
jgi:transcriptional regulator with XRE-family HTH domain